MKKYLSYILDPRDLVWPGEPNIEVTQCTKIGEDSACNTFCSKLPNHCGTHYDAPWHFNAAGPKITELPIEYFCFDRVLVLGIPKKADEGITPEDLMPYEDRILKADLLLIKTGFAFVRQDDPVTYQQHGPYLTPEVADYLVRTFPDLRTVGFDFLSIGSPANDLSAPAHQTLLGCHTDHFVTGIEDMDLRPLYEAHGKIRSVIAAPLRIVEVDSSQVCVIADFEE